MSMDKSLKGKSALERHRNVLSRAERIQRLKELGRWEEGSSAMSLPKVAHRKAAVGKKDKAEKKEEGDTAAAAAAAAPAASTDTKAKTKAKK